MAAGLPGVSVRQRRKALRKDAAQTIPSSAIETASSQANPNRSTLAWEIAQGPEILAVDMTRVLSAKRTHRSARGAGGHDQDHAILFLNTFQTEARCIWKTDPQRAGGGSHLPLKNKTFLNDYALSILSTKNADEPFS
jgi:hypothetical protein